MTRELESWHTPAYAAEWANDDVVADLLVLPRRISAALVGDAGTAVEHVIDIGSGPGAFLEVFLRAFPNAGATWTDVSEAMLELGREQLAPYGDRISFAIVDAERLDDAGLERADVIVTSRVLHHLSPESLARVYASVHALLRPGGWFFNLDHIGPPHPWEQRYRAIRDQFTGARKRSLAPHRQDYPLASVESHLSWARDAGFEDLDTPWRTFYTALIAAHRSP